MPELPPLGSVVLFANTVNRLLPQVRRGLLKFPSESDHDIK
jgi:hypothetical protein